MRYPNRFKNRQTGNIQNVDVPPVQYESPPPVGIASDHVGAGELSFEDSGIEELTEEELTLENDDVFYQFDQKTGGLKSVVLKKFREDDRKTPLSLVNKSFSFYAILI